MLEHLEKVHGVDAQVIFTEMRTCEYNETLDTSDLDMYENIVLAATAGKSWICLVALLCSSETFNDKYCTIT